MSKRGVQVALLAVVGGLLATGVENTTQAQGPAAQPAVLVAAELSDRALGPFHNALFPFTIDQILDDRGVRMGSIGSDMYPGDSVNEFWMVTDRGPNGNPGRRTFLAPTFNPVIVSVRVQGSGVSLLRSIPITDANGNAVTGLPNVPGFDETPWNFNGTAQIPGNPNGLDTEGIVRTRSGDFWLVDEYSPSLVHVAPDGRVLDRFVPIDSTYANTLATTPNYRVRKSLPKILNFRRQNRGFEGLALAPDDRTLFLAMQSPLEYPTRALGRASRNVRIFRFDIASEQVTGEFVYQLDEACAFSRQPTGCTTAAPGDMKLSSLIAVGATTLLVNERTDFIAKVYKVELSTATNILGSAWDTVAPTPADTTTALETLATPSTQGVIVLPKTLIVDLSTLPGMPDKIEGMALAKGDVLVVANDNDFGLVDEAAFDSRGRLSNDTGVRSKLLFVQLPAPVK